jgi:hypothetical protein
MPASVFSRIESLNGVRTRTLVSAREFVSRVVHALYMCARAHLYATYHILVWKAIALKPQLEAKKRIARIEWQESLGIPVNPDLKAQAQAELQALLAPPVPKK